MNLTLSIIKPDAVKKKKIGEINSLIRKKMIDSSSENDTSFY